MFFLVVFEKIPATSLEMPLFAKFLIFTLVLVTLSIVINVIIIRIHWKAIEYVTMPRWIRRLFLQTVSTKMEPSLKKNPTIFCVFLSLNSWLLSSWNLIPMELLCNHLINHCQVVCLILKVKFGHLQCQVVQHLVELVRVLAATTKTSCPKI